jgi:hypothetical protein
MTQTIIDLNSINLGADSAEDDIKIGLQQYFVKTQEFQEISGGKKSIVIGNRGSGKSAIFKYLASQIRASGDICIELSPDDYSYSILSDILKQEGRGNWGKQSSYSISWQYLLYNIIFLEISNKDKLIVSNAKKNIHNYVRDNLKNIKADILTMFVGYLKQIEGLKFGEYGVSFKKTELAKVYDLQDQRALEPDLKRICEKTKIYVLVDELDKGWDNSEDARYFVSGLLQAAQKLNEIHVNLRILVSIRQELFENLPQIYDDAQKLRGKMARISWNESSLLDFISERIRHNVKGASSIKDNYGLWELLFDSQLEYRKANSFNYIIDRTQLRPREFLQLVRTCVETGAKLGLSKINYDSIAQALSQYSEDKARDLASEYRFQYPGLLEIFEQFRGLKYSLEKSSVEDIIIGILIGERKLKNATWIDGLDTIDIIRVLWEIGFLKCWVVGGLKTGRKTGSSYVGYYEHPSVILENITRFQIHPAFWHYYNLKEK